MPMPRELKALMQRFNALGRLLPKGDEIDVAALDEQTRAAARVVIAEMEKVRAEIDAFIDAARAERLRRDADLAVR